MCCTCEDTDGSGTRSAHLAPFATARAAAARDGRHASDVRSCRLLSSWLSEFHEELRMRQAIVRIMPLGESGVRGDRCGGGRREGLMLVGFTVATRGIFRVLVRAVASGWSSRAGRQVAATLGVAAACFGGIQVLAAVSQPVCSWSLVAWRRYATV
jgi:hypothetical protein